MLRIPAFPLFCFAIFLFCIPVGKELGPDRAKPAPATPPKAPDAGSKRVLAAAPPAPAITVAAVPDSTLSHTHGSPRSLVVHGLH
jgi:hypothetical protein